MGVIPLMVALMFVVALGAYSSPSYAAQATQTVTVTVPEAIAIEVDNVGNWVVEAGATNTSQNFTVKNRGNVKIDLYMKANSPAFTSTSGATDTIPIDDFYIFSKKSDNYQKITQGYAMIYENLNKAAQGSGNPTTWSTTLKLTVPAYTEDGTYTITNTYAAVKTGKTLPYT